MSQLDSGTFQQVKDLVLSGYHLNDIHGLACPTALLPQDTNVESLERFALERFRFRGAMDTTSIDDFVRYSVGYAREDEKARCFIDADNMLARSIFNIGTLDNPGHADNVASIKLKKNRTVPRAAVDQRRSPQSEANRRMAGRLERLPYCLRCRRQHDENRPGSTGSSPRHHSAN
ncbi:Uncharacterized conserved protein [Klebsiella pneumoniae]|nr:Uncharacterized conserved protein [Klebsiella oxytoca]SWO49843.1 Uncharacterized conserved protein [Klebsiella pneumoniae]